MSCVDPNVLASVKRSLRVTTTAFDDEIRELIMAAMADLGIAGVVPPSAENPLILTAIKTYVKVRFGSPDEYERLKAAYDEQKAQLSMATGYTNWGGADGSV